MMTRQLTTTCSSMSCGYLVKEERMGKLFKNRKVVLAIVALVVTLVSVGLGTDLVDGTAEAITGVICQVVTCN